MNPMASKLDDHLGALREHAHRGHELEIQVLLPDLEGGDQEIVDAGDERRLQQQLGLRSALLAGDQHFGDGGGFGVGEHAVHVAHEVAAQRNQEQHAQAAAGHADADGLRPGADPASECRARAG